MNRPKKSIVFALITAMLFLIVPETRISAESKMNYSYMTDLLVSLKIIELPEEGDPNKEKVLNSYITRAEFAKLLCNTNGLRSVVDTVVPKKVFGDVEPESQFAGDIYVAYESGLINGFSDGCFKPQNQININEAVTSAVCMLGYKYHAEAAGGYPGGYLALASRLGLLNNIDFGAESLTAFDVYKLLYKALHTEIFVEGAVKDSGGAYQTDKETTLLSERHNVTCIKGVVDGNDLTRLRGGNDIPPYHVTIDGKEFYIGETGADKFLGCYVEAYFRPGSFLDNDSLISIRKLTQRNYETIINIEDIISISGGRVIYHDENGKRMSLGYDVTAAVIYNGASTTYPINDSLIPQGASGTVKFISHSGDRASVLIIDASTDYVVKSFNTSDYMLYDLYDSNKKICLNLVSENPFVELYDSNGDEGNITLLKSFAVVTIFESKDDAVQSYIRAFINENPFQGIVEEVVMGEKGIKAVIDGKQYSLSRNFADVNTLKIKVGCLLEFALNYYGEIAGARICSDGSGLWGYLIGIDVHSRLDYSVTLKIFKQNGTWAIYKLADNVIVDGIKYKKSDEKLLRHLNRAAIESNRENNVRNPDCYAQLLQFTINNQDDISKIDTVLNDAVYPADLSTSSADNKVYYKYVNQKNYYLISKSFGAQALADNNTLVFICPAVTDISNDYLNDEEYGISNMSLFVNSYRYSVKTFYASNNKVMADVVVVSPDQITSIDKLTSSSSYAMISLVTNSMDDKDNPCKKIYMYKGGVEVSILADPNFTFTDVNGQISTIDKLNCGDCVIYAPDAITGKLRELKVGYSAKEDKVGVSINMAFTATVRLVRGYVYKIFDDGFMFSKTSIPDDIPTAEMEIMIKPNCPVVVYDSTEENRKKVRLGTVREIDSYDSVGDKCTRIVFHMNYGLSRSVFLIK